MKRLSAFSLCALLLAALFGCTEAQIIDSRAEQDPIRIIGTVQSAAPTW